MSHHWSLPGEPRAAGMARALVGEALGSWSAADDALLITSELVTNAVEHGLGPVELGLAMSGPLLRISVRSTTAGGEPRIGNATEEDEGGRGLAIVGALGRQWGWERDGDQVVVWAELVGE